MSKSFLWLVFLLCLGLIGWILFFDNPLPPVIPTPTVTLKPTVSNTVMPTKIVPTLTLQPTVTSTVFSTDVPKPTITQISPMATKDYRWITCYGQVLDYPRYRWHSCENAKDLE